MKNFFVKAGGKLQKKKNIFNCCFSPSLSFILQLTHLTTSVTLNNTLLVRGDDFFERWSHLIFLLFTAILMDFLGVYKTRRSIIDSHMIVVKLWNGSEALQISNNGLDC